MKTPEKDYYSILDTGRDADIHEIRKSYLRLVKKYHPDTQPDGNEGDTEKFQSVLEAYRILSDPKLRTEYDQAFPGFQRAEKRKDQTDENIKGRAEKLCHEGIEAYRAGDFNRAIEYLQIAANLAPANPHYLSSLGLALSRKKRRLHEARNWCEKAVKLEPYNANYYVNLAIVYKEAGLNKMAQRYLIDALKTDPENKRAHTEMKAFGEGNDLKGRILDIMRKTFKKAEKG